MCRQIDPQEKGAHDAPDLLPSRDRIDQTGPQALQHTRVTGERGKFRVDGTARALEVAEKGVTFVERAAPLVQFDRVPLQHLVEQKWSDWLLDGRVKCVPCFCAVGGFPGHGGSVMTYLVRGRLAVVLAVALLCPEARGEDLNDAWSQAIGLNAGLQARELDSFAAAMNLGAARSSRLPSVSLTSLNAFLSQSPTIRVPASLAAGSSGSAFKGGFPASAPIRATCRSYSPTSASRFTRVAGFAATSRHRAAGLNYQKTEEFRTVLDLKLTVAEAYVGVLRARRNLDVLRSNLAQLSSFLTDVTNRKNEGRATRNEELAAQVSLANAKLQQISARKDLHVAWVTYNRYLYRPPGMVVDLEEIGGRHRRPR